MYVQMIVIVQLTGYVITGFATVIDQTTLHLIVINGLHLFSIILITFILLELCQKDICLNGGRCILDFNGNETCACGWTHSGSDCRLLTRKFCRQFRYS